MKLLILSIMWTCGLCVLRTVDVGPILDLDLTLYQLSYDKEKGQVLRDMHQEDGFSASKVEMRGMETSERVGHAYIAVDGPLYKITYCLHTPDLHFIFGKLSIPSMGTYLSAKVTSANNKMDRILEYTPLINGRCIVSDLVIWTSLGDAFLSTPQVKPINVSEFFNSSFRQFINNRSGYANRELDSKRCKEFTTPFSTIIV